MKGTGLMIKHMVEDFTLTLMALGMKESGKMINNMALELRDGLMELSTKVNTLKERNMGRANSFGQTRVLIMESSLITIYKEWAFTNGQMEGYITENGSITKCRGMGHSHGLMGGNM